MGLAIVLGRWCHTAQGVLSMRDRFKVVWIHTRGRQAQMIYLQTFGNRPLEQPVSKLVRGDKSLPAPEPALLLDGTGHGPHPEPAIRGLEDFCPEAPQGFSIVSHGDASLFVVALFVTLPLLEPKKNWTTAVTMEISAPKISWESGSSRPLQMM
jgi:hypothetical protein